jgi:hypothetical protein
LDTFTANHLNKWLDSNVRDDERDSVLDSMLKWLDANPWALDEGYSWNQVKDSASGLRDVDYDKPTDFEVNRKRY